MKELKNKKTGQVHLVSEDEYLSIKANGHLKKFTVTEVEPIRKLIPIPKLTKPEVEIKKIKSKK